MMRLLTLLTVVIMSLLLTCTGTGSEVEGKRFAIEGRAMYADDGPVAGAKVRIRPNGFLALYANEFPAFDTITDAQGFFYFDTIPSDSYTVEINKNGAFGALQKLSIGAYDSFPIVLPTATLTPTGTIFGRINLPISDDTVRPFVALYNVDYLVKAPITHDFRFEGLPEGVYSLMIVPTLVSKLFVQLGNISVIGDSAVDAGTLNLKMQSFFKGCTSPECDSMAVRSILDANGLTDVHIEDVAVVDQQSGRVIGLKLAGRELNVVPKDIGSLSMLTMLDLRNNRLVSLSEHIGYLKNLTYCYLDSNQLYELPYELSFIDSLKELTVRDNRLYQFDGFLINLPVAKLDLGYNNIRALPSGNRILPGVRLLYLDHNQLTGLPDAITGIRPELLSIAGNRLCDVPENISSWLTSLDENWIEEQSCEQQ